MLKAVSSTIRRMGGSWMKKGLFEKTMDAGGLAIGGYFGLDAYQEARQNGSGVIGATASGIKEFALPFLLSPLGYAAYSLAAEAPEMAVTIQQAYNSKARQTALDLRNTAFASAQFNDSEQAFTMRQAGMAQLQRSRYNTQQALLGTEAKYMMR